MNLKTNRESNKESMKGFFITIESEIQAKKFM